MITVNDLKRQLITEERTYAYISARVCNLHTANLPSAGPRPNITGMRAKFWGSKAIIVKQGQYAYKL